MYKFLDDKELLTKLKRFDGDLMQDLCHTLKEKYDIGANFNLVGSGARNLITQNAKEPIDLDYNLKIVRCEDINDCKVIKENVRKALNAVLKSYGLYDCEDSTTALTTKTMYIDEKGNVNNHIYLMFSNGYFKSATPFSIDVCIICESAEVYCRLIHDKTGFVMKDRYFWNLAPESKNVDKKAKKIKNQGEWLLVREEYLKLKNKYLRNYDKNKTSFVCYIEAVNNVYNNIYN